MPREYTLEEYKEIAQGFANDLGRKDKLIKDLSEALERFDYWHCLLKPAKEETRTIFGKQT